MLLCLPALLCAASSSGSSTSWCCCACSVFPLWGFSQSVLLAALCLFCPWPAQTHCRLFLTCSLAPGNDKPRAQLCPSLCGVEASSTT